jgi:leucyl aminopeptidase
MAVALFHACIAMSGAIRFCFDARGAIRIAVFSRVTRASMFFTDETAASTPVHLVHEDGFDVWVAEQDELTRNWAAANSFKGERNKVLLVPSATGRAQSVLVGLGRRSGREDVSCWSASGLPDRLPEGKYHLANELSPPAAAQFAFGWAYGHYRFERYRKPAPRPCRHAGQGRPPGR